MAPKKRSRDSSMSAEARDRYQSAINRGKQFIAERGFDTEMANSTCVYLGPMIHDRGWQFFVVQRVPAVIPVCREFYAALPDSVDGWVTVRGARILTTGEAINRILEIHPPVNDEYAALCLEEFTPQKAEEIRSWLQERDIAEPWSMNGSEFIALKRRSLSSAAKVWFYFICASLMPILHHNTVRKDRALLLYAVTKGLSINVGNLIGTLMRESASNDRLAFWFPSLVTMMCRSAGVPIENDEELLAQDQPLDVKWWHRLSTPRRNGRSAREAARAARLAEQVAGASSSVPPPTVSLEDRMAQMELTQRDHIAYSEMSFQRISDMIRYQGTCHGFDMTGYPAVPSWSDFRRDQPGYDEDADVPGDDSED